MGACEVSSGCYEIYSIGSAKFLKEVFNSVAMVCGSDNFVQACAVAIMLGIILIIVKGILTGGGKIEVGAVVVSALVASIMFVPKGTVIVEDVYDGSTYTIDNVPVGVAAPGMFISRIGYSIAELIDQGFSTVDTSYGITRRPFLESTQILTSLRDNSDFIDRVWDQLEGDTASDLKRSFLNYFQECSMLKFGFDKTKSMAKDYKMSSDNLISDFRSDVRYTEIYLDGGSETLTCTRAGTKLKAKLSQLNGTTLDNAFKQPSTSGESYSSKMDNAVSLLGGSSADMINMVKSSILKPIYEKAAQGFLISTGDIAAATAINQAISQRNVQWSLEQSLFLNTIRPMITFFEGFVYAITPFMAILICMGAFGLGIAIKYFQTLIWIQLWLPILAIINLYIYMSALSAISTNSGIVGQHLDSFYAIDNLVNVVETWTSTGGMLAAMTPMIAFFIVAGSAYTFTSIAGRLGGADHIDEKIVSPDVVKQNPLLTNEKGTFTYTNVGRIYTGVEPLEDTINCATTAARTRQTAFTRLISTAVNYADSIVQAGSTIRTGGKTHSFTDVNGHGDATSDSSAVVENKVDSQGKDAGNTSTNTLATEQSFNQTDSAHLTGKVGADVKVTEGGKGKKGKGKKGKGKKDVNVEASANIGVEAQGGRGWASSEISRSMVGRSDSIAENVSKLISKGIVNNTNDTQSTNRNKTSSDGSNYGINYDSSTIGNIQNAKNEASSAQRQFNEAVALEQRTTTSGNITTKAAFEAIRNNGGDKKENWNKIEQYLTSNQDRATLQAKSNYYQRTLGYDQATARKAALIYTAANSDSFEAADTLLSMMYKATGNNYGNKAKTDEYISQNENINDLNPDNIKNINPDLVEKQAANAVYNAKQGAEQERNQTIQNQEKVKQKTNDIEAKNKGKVNQEQDRIQKEEGFKKYVDDKKLHSLSRQIDAYNKTPKKKLEKDELPDGIDEYNSISSTDKNTIEKGLKQDQDYVTALFKASGLNDTDIKSWNDLCKYGKGAGVNEAQINKFVNALSKDGLNKSDVRTAINLLNSEYGFVKDEWFSKDDAETINTSRMSLIKELYSNRKNQESYVKSLKLKNDN